MIPHDVYTEGIKAHSLDHLKPVFPILIRNSGIMNLSRKYFIWNVVIDCMMMKRIEAGLPHFERITLSSIQ
jgi:hypothetical protein